MRLLRGLLLAMCMVCPTVCAGATLYTVVDLGISGASAGGYSLTAAGTVAGWYEQPGGVSQAFVASGGVVRSLSPLQPGYDSQAFGINSSGEVAGVAYTAAGGQAVVWRQRTPQALGNGAATAINSSGQATGGIQTASGATHGFATSGAGWQDIGTLNGGTWSSGFAINDHGLVAGYGDTAASGFHALLWDPATGLADLGTLGGRNSYALAVNNSGIVVGHSETAAGETRAFQYVNGQLQGLGSLDGGNSYGYGVNAYGAVVGYSTNGSLGQTAFLYRNGAMFNLNALLVNASPYYLTAAYAINDRGQIAGTALLNGVEQAIRLDPVRIVSAAEVVDAPEPSTVALLLLPLAGLAGWGIGGRQRSRR